MRQGKLQALLRSATWCLRAHTPKSKASSAIKLDTEKGWTKSGMVISAQPENRTYLIDTPQGPVRRNRHHLQPVRSPPPQPPQIPDTYFEEPEPEPPLIPIPPVTQPQLPMPSVPPVCTLQATMGLRRFQRPVTRPARLIESC